jgi:hypothetical protein
MRTNGAQLVPPPCCSIRALMSVCAYLSRFPQEKRLPASQLQGGNTSTSQTVPLPAGVGGCATAATSGVLTAVAREPPHRAWHTRAVRACAGCAGPGSRRSGGQLPTRAAASWQHACHAGRQGKDIQSTDGRMERPHWSEARARGAGDCHVMCVQVGARWQARS